MMLLVPLCRDAIRAKTKVHGSRPALAAWVMIFELADQNVPWAIALAKELWPTDPDEAVEIINVANLDQSLSRISLNCESNDRRRDKAYYENKRLAKSCWQNV